VPVQFDAVAEEYDIMRTTVAFNDVLTRVCGVQAG
jgi:hypothetical protein